MNACLGFFYGGALDGDTRVLTEADIARGFFTAGDGTHYAILELDEPKPVGEFIATHKLIPQE